MEHFDVQQMRNRIVHLDHLARSTVVIHNAQRYLLTMVMIKFLAWYMPLVSGLAQGFDFLSAFKGRKGFSKASTS